MTNKLIAALITISLTIAVFMPQVKADIPSGYTEIADRAGLEAIANNPDGNYILTDNINLYDGAWTPIPFNGTFDGNGKVIYNLSIVEPDPITAVSVDGNHKEYDTVFAALFSRTTDATIKNLSIYGSDVKVSTDQNAFASFLVGYAENTAIDNCNVKGRVELRSSNKMCGVAGLVGFGYGTVTNSSVETTLTLVDENKDIKCEEFMGGVLGTGYMDIDNVDCTVKAYTSVYGYVHNGGLVGMYYVHTADRSHKGYIKNSTSDAEINFFEANDDRRAYCDPILGEKLHWSITQDNNTIKNFVNGETKDYKTILLPEKCEKPSYSKAIHESDCTELGYAVYTCDECKYSYNADYMPPAHLPGEWVKSYDDTTKTNVIKCYCAKCDILIDEIVLIKATSCVFNPSSIQLKPNDEITLVPELEPEGVVVEVKSYTTSDEGVATVDANGKVKAIRRGTATITGTFDGIQGSYVVNVKGIDDIVIIAIATALLLLAFLVILLFYRKRR